MQKTKKAAAPVESQTPAAAALPLFFQRPAALDSERHAQAAIRTKTDLSFARACNSVPLNTVEFIEASHFYPIVFTNDEAPVPVAVLSWDKDNNPYVTEANEWRENHYVPAYVRQYPFILSHVPANDALYLCVDEGASSFVSAMGKSSKNLLPLYTENQPSKTAQRALEFTTAFYQHARITRNFCDDLKKLGLLSPYNASARVDGTDRQLNNFLMVDETALNALPAEEFLSLRSKGWLPFIYLALASTSNWKRGLK